MFPRLVTALPRWLVSTRSVSSGLITGLGTSFSILYVYIALTRTISLTRSVEIVLLLTLSLMIAYAGVWLLRSNYHSRWVVRTAGWTVSGFVLMVFLSYWIVLRQLTLGTPFYQAMYVTLNIGTIGATGGLLVGLQETRANERAAYAREADVSADRARGRVAFINRLLRHHVLNGLNIINGYTDRLIDRASGDPPDELRRIRSRSDAIVDLISNVDILSRTFTNELTVEPTQLAPSIETAIDTAEMRYYRLDITGEFPTECWVAAGSPLVTVFGNLFDYIANHVETDHVQIAVEIDMAANAVVVRLHVPAMMLPPAERDSLLDPGDHGDGNLGMYLVDAIVATYDGDIWIEDADPGTVFTILLDRVDPPPTSN